MELEDLRTPIQPKKIDGVWEFPVDLPLPEKKIRFCPKCNGNHVKVLRERSPHGQHVFWCKDCRIKFYQDIKTAYCKRYKRHVRPEDCRRCSLFNYYMNRKIQCPNFTEPPKEKLEGFDDKI